MSWLWHDFLTLVTFATRKRPVRNLLLKPLVTYVTPHLLTLYLALILITKVIQQVIPINRVHYRWEQSPHVLRLSRHLYELLALILESLLVLKSVIDVIQGEDVQVVGVPWEALNLLLNTCLEPALEVVVTIEGHISCLSEFYPVVQGNRLVNFTRRGLLLSICLLLQIL